MSVEGAKDLVEVPQEDEIDDERGSCSDLRLLASADTADLTALSAEVQAIAHRFNAEFEAVLAAGEADSGAGSAIVQRLLPTVVAVLEQLDEFYKDHAAYKAEVIQLREETTSLLSQLVKEKAARRDTEEVCKLSFSFLHVQSIIAGGSRFFMANSAPLKMIYIFISFKRDPLIYHYFVQLPTAPMFFESEPTNIVLIRPHIRQIAVHVTIRAS